MASLCLATLLLIGMLAVHYEDLPDRVASHFDLHGNVDGWSSKNGFVAMMSGVGLFLFVLFAGLGPLTRKMPDSLINMPNKGYWLAPEQREASFLAMHDRLLWMGAVTQLLLLGGVYASMRASIEHAEPVPSWFSMALLWGYLLFTVVWLVEFYRRFGKPPAA